MARQSATRHIIDCVFQVDTGRAIGIWKDDDSPSIIWLPASQVTVITPSPERGNVIQLSVPEWLLIEKELV